MIAAHFCFSLMIVLIKAAQHIQTSRASTTQTSSLFGTWESVLFRSLPMCAICLFVLLRRRSVGHAHPKLERQDWIWLATRGLIGAASMACFFYGTLHIPIALASLFSNASVFFVGLLGHFFLSEKLTRTRVAFAIAGFAGVALVLGTGFMPTGHILPNQQNVNQRAYNFLIAFLSGFFSSIAYFSVRKMKRVPGNTIILSLSLSGVLLAFCSALFIEPLHIPSDPDVLALLCLSGIPAAIAQYLMTWSFQSAEASFVALGQYTGPVFAAALGAVAFGETLTHLQWFGVGVTICFGIMMPIVDERRIHRKKKMRFNSTEYTSQN